MWFDFNLHSGLLLPIVLQGLIFGLVLLVRGLREQRLTDRLLGFFLIFAALLVAQWMLGFAGWYNEKDGRTQFMYYSIWDWTLALGPLLYFYFRALTNTTFRLKRAHWLHFLPIALIVVSHIVSAIFDLLITQELNGEILPYDGGAYGEWYQTGLGKLGIALHTLSTPLSLVYWAYTYYLFRRYRQYVNENFSDDAHISFRWLGRFLPLMLIAFSVWFTRGLLMQLGIIANDAYITSWYFYMAWGVVIYFLSIQGAQAHTQLRQVLDFQPVALGEKTKESLEPKITNNSSVGSEELEELKQIADQLDTAMSEQELFLEADLNLKRVASATQLPSPRISRAINEVKGQNFNEYVNGFRVARVRELLQGTKAQEFSLLGVALEAGFNSKATFNRVFKQHTGQTPSQYVKSLIQ
ncbi:MAG: AraC family transcriptional regulator [Bacteroidota bacterium]